MHRQFSIEEQTNYRLLVEAMDHGVPKRLSTVAPISVTVMTTKDGSPRLRTFYRSKIPGDVPVGHTVLQIAVCHLEFKYLKANLMQTLYARALALTLHKSDKPFV